MKPYEWMVEFTPQTNWIEGHGIWIWFAEVSGILGGGLYLVSLWFNSAAGMFAGWFIVVVLKGCFHLAHLGHPLRFWRLFLKPKSSWLARGLFFVALFAILCPLQFAVSVWLPEAGWEAPLRFVTAVLGVLVVAYSGLVMNYVNGIQFWNTAMLPFIFVVFGILGGIGGLMMIGLPDSNTDVRSAFSLILIVLSVGTFSLVLYLWTATYVGPAAKRSVIELARGSLALPFWIGVIVCGLLIPAAATSYMYVSGNVLGVLVKATAAGLVIGVFGISYCVLKGGVYRPLAPVTG